MYCPECTGEYRKGIETCPTCEVPLTESLDPEARDRRGPRLVPALVDLIGFVEETQARDARKRLKDAKIPCELVIRDAHTGPGEDPATGDEFWIRVPGAAVPAASDVLSIETVLSENACPSCGARLEDDQDCPTCAPE